MDSGIGLIAGSRAHRKVSKVYVHRRRWGYSAGWLTIRARRRKQRRRI